METIYASNRMESLCKTLADNIKNSRQAIFNKEIIITQSAGMNAWLKTELAQRNGVFANFEFQNQDGFLAEMYQMLFNESPKNNIDAIKYKIFETLEIADFKTEFPEVANYYLHNDLRRFQLAGKIADLFDQYQLYRPEMINDWDKGSVSTENKEEKWQQWLWKKLGTESRVKFITRIIQEFNEQKNLIQKKFPVISLFGISVYTKFHLDFFKEIAIYTEVNFYLCLPSNQPISGNELLLSFGSKAEELATMFNHPVFEPDKNSADTLLSQIQNKIFDNENGINWIEDDSVQINSCYTPIREAECLYNYLLDLFENNKELRPRDVLVMTTDINKYAPYVKAVFRNAPVNIPFQVSGSANNSDDSMASALEQILTFMEDDLSSEKVISLLEQKRIKQRFGIKDCNYIRTVVGKANIRFGRENQFENDTRYVSWKYGLEKILLGYAMLTDEEYQLEDGTTLFPFKDAEASGSYDLFRLKAFVSTLESVIDVQKESKTLAGWKLFLMNEVVEKMVYWDDFKKEDRAELSSIYQAVSFTDKLDLKEEVSFSIFLDELKSKLFTENKETKLNTGRVTVSSAIPVRGLPYKVICFIGLNNDIFPRKDRFMGFDLLGEAYQEGDRNIKETDKYLFLDTILAAREKLYFSYIGQSVKDNTEIPPSIVVDTLLDYIDQEKFVVKHPLHGFSSKYQKEDKRLFTYLYSEKGSESMTKVEEPEELKEISVSSFVKFFEHPIEWYFNVILGIKYEDNNDTLPETELFKLGDLQRWQVKNEFLKLDDVRVEAYLQKGIKEGSLPLKNLGRLIFNGLVGETVAIRSTFQSLTQEKEERKVLIDLKIDKIQILGTIDGVYDRQHLSFSLSKSIEKNMVRAYLRSLLLFAMNEIDSALIIDKDGVCSNLPIMSPKQANSKIAELLVYFKTGMETPLKFTIKATQPPNAKTPLSIDTVRKAFQSEADGNPNIKPAIPPNRYILNLLHEGYLQNFNDAHYLELTKLAGLLNLLIV